MASVFHELSNTGWKWFMYIPWQILFDTISQSRNLQTGENQSLFKACDKIVLCFYYLSGSILQTLYSSVNTNFITFQNTS